MFEVGRHQAKITDYGMKETNAGDPQIFISLKGMEKGDLITWFGSLKEGKAREITLKTLITCGFTGNSVANIAQGVSANCLDTKKELSIVVSENEYQGKKSMRVDWINEPSAGIQNRLTQVEAIQKTQGYNLEGALIQLRREMQGTATQSAPEVSTGQQQQFAADDIPF